MITEDYVSPETAKLLKEKGFDGECDCLYVNGDIVRVQGDKCNWNKGETIFTDYKNECSAPTLQMAMKWLREVKHYYIQVSIQNDGTYIGYIYRTDGFPYVGYDKRHVKTTPEEACEERIKYCLENLI